MTTTASNASANLIPLGDELDLEQLDAVSGGNVLVEGLKLLVGHAVGKVIDATIDALGSAGPAPTTNHGSVYGSHPDGFVG